jgi:hypothetical protein
MIGVLVSQDDSFDALRRYPHGGEPTLELATGETGVHEQAPPR